MSVADLVKQSRSFRRFDPTEPISTERLAQWVDAARLCPSAANLQPLKYMICTGKTCDEVFPHLSWAGYFNEWPGPEPHERPSAYIVILGDTTVTKNFGIDQGITAQTLLLAATEAGFGGCMLGALNRTGLSEALDLPEHLEVLLVLALGNPGETVVIEEVQNDNIKYRRDENDVHHVPKRPLAEILLASG